MTLVPVLSLPRWSFFAASVNLAKVIYDVIKWIKYVCSISLYYLCYISYIHFDIYIRARMCTACVDYM